MWFLGRNEQQAKMIYNLLVLSESEHEQHCYVFHAAILLMAVVILNMLPLLTAQIAST